VSEPAIVAGGDRRRPIFFHLGQDFLAQELVAEPGLLVVLDGNPEKGIVENLGT